MKQRVKNKIPEELLEKAQVLFGNLSKEELISKFLKTELDSLNLDRDDDINDEVLPERKGDRDRDRNRGRGSRGRGGSGRGRGRGRGRHEQFNRRKKSNKSSSKRRHRGRD